MMGSFVKPSASKAFRIAATRPSIMSEGATISAPARTWLTAESAKSLSVGSFCSSLCLITPQWPCDVYSHRHTSVIRSRSRTFSRIAQRLLNDAVVIICVGTGIIFLWRKAKQQDSRDAGLFRIARCFHCVFDRQIVLAGHRADLMA